MKLNSFECIAPAKINLHLRVLNRRPDGYHNIFSLMAGLDLSDILVLDEFNIKDNGEIRVALDISGGEYAPGIRELDSANNLVTIGVKNYLEGLGIGADCRFTLAKNIPAGAGLGGGSSDCASAIELIRRALGRDRDHYYYSAASASGSDVPFFLHGGFSFAGGRGEIIESCGFNSNYDLLLVNNGIHIDTGLAYRGLGRSGDDSSAQAIIRNDRKIITEGFHDILLWKDIMINDFEPVIFKQYPEIGRIKQMFYEFGADFSAMTGSGSTVFGVFSDAECALWAEQLLKSGNNVIHTKFRTSIN